MAGFFIDGGEGGIRTLDRGYLYTLSRRAPSTARTPLRMEVTHPATPNTRQNCYRCSLPGLAEFTARRCSGTRWVTIGPRMLAELVREEQSCAFRAHTNFAGYSGLGQGLIQIFQNVVYVLDANGQSNGLWFYATRQLFFGSQLPVGGGCGVASQRFGVTNIY